MTANIAKMHDCKCFWRNRIRHALLLMTRTFFTTPVGLFEGPSPGPLKKSRLFNKWIFDRSRQNLHFFKSPWPDGSRARGLAVPVHTKRLSHYTTSGLGARWQTGHCRLGTVGVIRL